MKLYFFMLVFCLTAFDNFAQTFGKTILTGSFNLSTTGAAQDTYYGTTLRNYTTARIKPSIGFFLNPRLAVGATASYRFSDAYEADLSTGYGVPNTHMFSAGPFVRYCYSINTRAAVFGQATAALITGKQGENRADAPSISGSEFHLTPGITLFVTPKIGIDIMFDALRYERLKFSSENSNYNRDDSQFEAGFKMSNLAIGVSFYLARPSATE